MERDILLNKIIEQEYGIGASSFVSINERINKKVQEYKKTGMVYLNLNTFIAEAEFDIIRTELNNKIQDLQKDNNSKRLELAKIKQTWERDEEAIQKRIEEELKAKFDKEMEMRITMADEEKTELYGQIKDQLCTLEHFKNITTEYYDASMNKNWGEMDEINQTFKDIAASNEFIRKIVNEVNEKRERIEEIVKKCKGKILII